MVTFLLDFNDMVTALLAIKGLAMQFKKGESIII